MIYVVDGYNAIRRVERLRRTEETSGLEAGREALVAAILASGILRAHRVTVVFDGECAGMPSTPSAHPRLVVRYAEPPETADGAISRSLKRHRTAKDVTVVTADQELAFEARRLGARVTGPEQWSALRPPRSNKRAPARPRTDADKPQATSKAEVAYWLDVFGDENS